MNTLLVTVDALRADHIFGYSRKTFPFLNEIGRGCKVRGTAYANGPNTISSVPSILTSSYQGQNQAISGPTIGSVLQNNGISTAGFHSNTLLSNELGVIAGFNHFEDFGITDDDTTSDSVSDNLLSFLYQASQNPVVSPLRKAYDRLAPDHWFYNNSIYVDAKQKTDSVIQWIENHQAEEWFVWVHYMDPHRPYGIDLGEPYFESMNVSNSEILRLMATAGQNPSDISQAQREQIINLYDSDIRFLSQQLSRLVDFLKKEDVWQGMNFLLTSDHGEEFGDHGKYFHRNLPYEELLEVPLLMKTSKPMSVQDEHDRQLIDIAPTICEIYDISPPKDFEGRPLSKPKSYPHIATGSFEGDDPTLAVRWKNWKYIYSGGQEELFDLSEDMKEVKSVLESNTEIGNTIREMVPTRLFSTGTESGSSVAEGTGEVRERLKKLGYIE
ncbi:MAG: sulfatase-like hydrolase/transferase [Halobacteriaceae archaeon]